MQMKMCCYLKKNIGKARYVLSTSGEGDSLFKCKVHDFLLQRLFFLEHEKAKNKSDHYVLLSKNDFFIPSLYFLQNDDELEVCISDEEIPSAG